jgi:hypothetical protein
MRYLKPVVVDHRKSVVRQPDVPVIPCDRVVIIQRKISPNPINVYGNSELAGELMASLYPASTISKGLQAYSAKLGLAEKEETTSKP